MQNIISFLFKINNVLLILSNKKKIILGYVIPLHIEFTLVAFMLVFSI